MRSECLHRKMVWRNRISSRQKAMLHSRLASFQRQLRNTLKPLRRTPGRLSYIQIELKLYSRLAPVQYVCDTSCNTRAVPDIQHLKAFFNSLKCISGPCSPTLYIFDVIGYTCSSTGAGLLMLLASSPLHKAFQCVPLWHLTMLWAMQWCL